MCRFVAYSGHEILMSDLLMNSSRSLIMQSYRAREREEPLNGDGFGVGWYARQFDPEPGLFTSVRPAWANRNLISLAPKIRSGCFFAHVRAASPGSPVTELNCHPFRAGRLLWMHNGRIVGFSRIKRRLRAYLDDSSYARILGTTDSEHAFALFLTELAQQGEEHSLAAMQRAMAAAIARIEGWLAEVNPEKGSRLNFAVTDGQGILATRYVTDGGVRPESLYVARGERFEIRDGQYRMQAAKPAVGSVIVASEPLTEARDDWQSVPPNHMVTVTPDLEVDVARVGA